MSITPTTLGIRLLRRQPIFFTPCKPSSTSFALRLRPIHPTTLLRRPYAKQSTPKKSLKSTSKTTPPSGSTGPKFYSLEASLAQQGQEIVLYQSNAPLFVFGYYALSVISIGWSSVNLYEALIIGRPGAPEWTKKVAMLTSGMGLMLGAYCFWVPSRLVQRIVAVPRRTTSSLTYQIQTRRLIPFLTKTVEQNADKVRFTEQFYKPVERAVTPQTGGLILGPLNFLKMQFVKVGTGLFRAIRMKDFVSMKIGSSPMAWQVDRRGYVWEAERKALDTLLGKQKRVFASGI